MPNWQLIAHALLGVFAGLLAPLFLLLLRGGEALFKLTHLPVMLKLGLGGLLVGLISLWQPDVWNGGGVWGNGYGVVASVLNSDWVWWGLLTILLLKVLATVATTGSGAVGGVFTPTLFCGAVIGSLYGEGLRALLPGQQIAVGSFAVVGMGCFLAATTRAPIMSILIMFEMTHNDATIMPLMLACVSAFYVARSLSPESVYSRQLQGRGASSGTPLFLLHVRDLMKKDPICVLTTSGFTQIAKTLASNTFKHLYVVDGNRRFLGAIALQDLKPFLHETDLPQVVIALDLLHDDIPVLNSDASLKESLEVFARHDGERLPVLDNPRDRRLVGSLAKTDVLLTLAHGVGGASRRRLSVRLSRRTQCRKPPRPIDEQQIEKHVVEEEDVHEDEAERMEREHDRNEDPAVVRRDEAERRGHFKERDAGQSHFEKKRNEWPFGDVPADVGVEVVAAQARVDGPDFHRVAGEHRQAAANHAIEPDQAVGEAEQRDDGDDGIGTPRIRR